MTNNKKRSDEPSPKQLGYLQRLSRERGNYPYRTPTTKWEASAEIKAMLARPKVSRADRRRENESLRQAVAASGDAASVRIEEETYGWGSAAAWGDPEIHKDHDDNRRSDDFHGLYFHS
jgi:hypothetical protein